METLHPNAIPWSEGLHYPNGASKNRSRSNPKYRGTFSYEHYLRQLTLGVNYEVMVRVESHYGWSEFSDKYRFYTRKSKFFTLKIKKKLFYWWVKKMISEKLSEKLSLGIYGTRNK